MVDTPSQPPTRGSNKGRTKDAGVLVIGLGRFGSAIAAELARVGTPVLAVERDADLVAAWAGRIALVEADATNPTALEQLGARDHGRAVVGVGSHLEASVLITANLVDLGVPQIWAKAISAEHGRILERIGAHHVVRPEQESGEHIAHLLSGRLLDTIEVEHGCTVVTMRPPRELDGVTLAQAQVRTRYGVTVIGVKSPGLDLRPAVPDLRVSAGDILVVAGEPGLLDRFSRRP